LTIGRRRLLLGAFTILLLGGLVRYGVPLWQARRANLREMRYSFQPLHAPKASDRILILAPHTDDETLATGGLIQQAIPAKATIKVVIVTNGDGFRYGAERLFKVVKVSPQQYRELGERRQRESLLAIRYLGLRPDQVTFLGYPDAGTMKMWLNNWAADRLYTARTGVDHSPYPNSMRHNAPYCGRVLLDDIKTVITQFKPTIIVCSHPNDDHPDHDALYAYTTAALYELGLLDRVQVLMALVHRGDWPLPQGVYKKKKLTPPAALSDLGMRWEVLPLTAAQTQRKYEAIAKYRSQTAVMGRFMLSFARANELFCQLPVDYLPIVPPGTIKLDGDVSEWEEMEPVILDPQHDEVTKLDLAPGGDISAVYAAYDRQQLFLRLDLWKPPSTLLSYQIHLRPLANHMVGLPRNYTVWRKRSYVGPQSIAKGRTIEVVIPLPEHVAKDGLMLEVDTHFRQFTIDKTAWVLLRNKDYE
jgi:LmbE family N-acetylglucosaminyl deacetylase